MGGGAPRVTSNSATLGRRALPQRLHQVDYPGRRAFLRVFDLFAALFLLDQLPERVLVVILEFLWLEMPGLGLDDMDCQIDHILGIAFIRYIIETILLLDVI